LKPELLSALKIEINLQKDYLKDKMVDTVYFGGGTPSILEIEEINDLMDAIHKNFNIDPHAEKTIETNPDDLNEQKTKDLKNAGFNRLSIGIQSFDDHTLKLLNRVHQAKDSHLAIRHAEKAGFNNLNLDLIFAITENHAPILKKDLKIITEVQPQHLSIYCLTIEPKTVFGNWNKKGKLREVSNDEAAKEFNYIIDNLCILGFDHYEVSNFARPGFISRHNSNYWRQIPYLGIGPSSHSFDGYTRQWNISNNSKYIKSLERKIIPAEIDYLSETDRINEQILTGLRTKWGVNLNSIKIKYGVDLATYYKSYIRDLIYLDLATFNNGILQLKKKGMLIADKICSELFLIDKND
jgi:oxygen-independent coproporphyrinogen-3 oxidase